MKAILKERYYNIGYESKYLVQICSQAKCSGIKLPEVHGVNKGINLDIKPERQALKFQNSVKKPRLGQGKEGLRREMRAPTEAQVQVQIKHEKQRREQTLIKQKEGLQAPQTKQTAVKYI